MKKSLEGDVPDALKKNFVLKDHGRHTQNNGCSMALPTIRTKYARLLASILWELKFLMNYHFILEGQQILMNLKG